MIRSVKLCRCGCVYRPTRRPAALAIEAIIAEVDPLPLLPATCANRTSRCGLPRNCSIRLTRSKVNSRGEREENPIPRSMSAKL